MTTSLDHRAATTPIRLRLPADLVTKLDAQAVAEGIGTEELVGRLLVEVLPGMVAERTGGWLRNTLSLAYPVDVPGIPKGCPDDGGMVLNDDIPEPKPGDVSESVTTTSTPSRSLPAGRRPRRELTGGTPT